MCESLYCLIETSSDDESLGVEAHQGGQFKPKLDLRYYEEIIKENAIGNDHRGPQSRQLTGASILLDEHSARSPKNAANQRGEGSTANQDFTLDDISSISNAQLEEEISSKL